MDIELVKADMRRLSPRKKYSHNIVSSYLRQIDAEFGTQAANDVIAELGLDKKYGISQRTVEGEVAGDTKEK